MYQQPGADGAAAEGDAGGQEGAEGEAKSDEEDVTDVEFEEVNDKDKK